MMMKKLLILMLVLGLASSANAVMVTLVPSGSGSHAAGDVVIDKLADDTSVHDAYIGIVDTTYGDMTITAYAAAGNESSQTDYGAALGYDHIIQISTKHGDPFDTIKAGAQFKITVAFTGAALGEDVVVKLLDASLGEADSYTIMGIPEPMTIALLGLGGLFLLRRRK
jgi:hypothetical protein